MAVRQNQGFRQDLNFEENTNDVQSLSNLGGVGIAGDLRIIQNNLRNTSTIGYVTFTPTVAGVDTSGSFVFPDREFVYTKDDVVGVSTSVSVGSTILTPGTDYFITGSNAFNRFKLSTTSSTSNLGIQTISITSVGRTDFSFIRKDPVNQPEIINFIRPDIQDDEEIGSYLSGSINDTFDSTQQNGETADYFVSKKYKGTADTETTDEIKFEGTVNLFDPASFNTNATALSDAKSPGIFIGDTRAFSSDNNPWSIDGTDLQTDSHEVSVGELFFANNITITGIGADYASGSEVDVTSFTHKVPVTINGETYYLLLKTP